MSPDGLDGVVSEWTEEVARTIVKEWVCIARAMSRCDADDLALSSGVGGHRLGMYTTPRRPNTPTPGELMAISAASGMEAPEIVRQACLFLHPEHLLSNLTAPEPPRDGVIRKASELKVWIKHARRSFPDGKLSVRRLAVAIGVSHSTVTQWEAHRSSALPSIDQVAGIANACSVPTPTIVAPSLRAPRNRMPLTAEEAPDLAEEILWTGRMLASRAYPPEALKRNSDIFFARFGGYGDDASTLQLVGDRFGMTRERVRQIIERQMQHLGNLPLRTECFTRLELACKELPTQPLAVAETTLRPMLGGVLGLSGAMDYGIEVLGRRLPLRIIPRKDAPPLVTHGEYPDWLDTAMNHSKRLIRHCGAAQFTLAWALTCRDIGALVDQGEYRRVVQMLPGFEWIDDRQTWYWLGPEGCANRMISRTVEILSAASGPLDIEIIYGGLFRARTRESDVSIEAGVFPPMEIVVGILSASPLFKCQQGDDFRLLLAPDQVKEKDGVAEVIVDALKAKSGLASRSELYDSVVTVGGLNPVSFAVALATSPLIRQVDRGVFAIRGWPLNAQRLQEAQMAVGVWGSVPNKGVELTQDGTVSWVATITEAAVVNGQSTLPSRAAPHVPLGEYGIEGTSRTAIVHPERIQGLVAALIKSGAAPGTAFRVTVNPAQRNIHLEIVPAEPNDETGPI